MALGKDWISVSGIFGFEMADGIERDGIHSGVYNTLGVTILEKIDLAIARQLGESRGRSLDTRLMH